MSDQIKRPITIAISALGGQGGGVLTNWLVKMAEDCDYFAQSTSVPGVAQRTGATIYYLEIFSKAAVRGKDTPPVMALMPMSGDVDIVIASELMEAGRAIIRQFVTPDKTTLITSTHRVYSISEKMALGDGTGDSATILKAASQSARDFIAFDMENLATHMNCVISSIMFGAIASSGRLPFAKEAFEAAIRAEGKMVDANLKGFEAGYKAAGKPYEASERVSTEAIPNKIIGNANTAEAESLIRRINALPGIARDFAYAGAKKLLDYQDIAYAGDYIKTVEDYAARDMAPYKLTRELARHLALWMAFDDVIRVADIKTRSERVEKYRTEIRAKDGQIVNMVEYLHPRLEEIVGIMPRPLANRVQSSSLLTWFFKKFTGPRLLDTTKISCFLMLYCIASLKPLRRKTARYFQEYLQITPWLDRIGKIMDSDYNLAVEIIKCQRLIKGYGDTHARGLGNFLSIMATIDNGGINAERVINLRNAALADEEGESLAKELSLS